VCDRQQTQLSEMTAGRDRLASELELLRASYNAMVVERSALLTETRQRRASSAALEKERNALVAAAAAHAQTQAELDSATRAGANLTGELAAIRASRSWRLTAPVRRFAIIIRRWM
jgi:hypothetical protein